MTFTFQNVDEEIPQQRLPSTSVHVLEEITETQEVNADVDTVAIPQSPYIDVMVLEHITDMQTSPSNTEGELRDETIVDNTTHVHVAPIQHQEIQVSNNVQSDLDLWARIREYDQRMANEGFTQVLSKKQHKAVKKQVLGKALYNTRAKGTPPPYQ